MPLIGSGTRSPRHFMHGANPALFPASHLHERQYLRSVHLPQDCPSPSFFAAQINGVRQTRLLLETPNRDSSWGQASASTHLPSCKYMPFVHIRQIDFPSLSHVHSAQFFLSVGLSSEPQEHGLPRRSVVRIFCLRQCSGAATQIRPFVVEPVGIMSRSRQALLVMHVFVDARWYMESPHRTHIVRSTLAGPP